MGPGAHKVARKHQAEKSDTNRIIGGHQARTSSAETRRESRGYSSSKAAHIARLSRIEGQVRGVKRMIEEDKYCIDILTQISAIQGALQSLALLLLEEHLGHCVAAAIRQGDPDEVSTKIAEAVAAVERFAKV
jgi:DNA-binding FrmR family transcriptional regulator